MATFHQAMAPHSQEEGAEPSVWSRRLYWVSSALLFVLSAWLLLADRVLGVAPGVPAVGNDQLVALLTIAVTVASLRFRPARIGVILLGIWLLITPWLISGGSDVSRTNSTIVAILIIACGIPLGLPRRGPVHTVT
jgi:hypothetical protein